MKRYLVFARTIGTQSWTLAHKMMPPIQNLPEHLKQFETTEETAIPAVFWKKESAELFAETIRKEWLGWWAGVPDQRHMEAYVAEVDLP